MFDEAQKVWLKALHPHLNLFIQTSRMLLFSRALWRRDGGGGKILRGLEEILTSGGGGITHLKPNQGQSPPQALPLGFK